MTDVSGQDCCWTSMTLWADAVASSTLFQPSGDGGEIDRRVLPQLRLK